MRDKMKTDNILIDFVTIFCSKKNSGHKEMDNKYYYDDLNFVYFLRGVAKYAKWVNKIFIVTSDKLPDYVDLSNNRIVVVSPKDFLSADENYNNINTIELNLSRIKELSNQFVYFNSGNFIVGELTEADFFIDGLPCLHVQESNYYDCNKMRRHILVNNTLELNKFFRRHDVYNSYPLKFISLTDLRSSVVNLYYLFLQRNSFFGFAEEFFPSPMLKRVCDIYYGLYEDEQVDGLMPYFNKKQFETDLDINYLISKYVHYTTGNFHPKNTFKYQKRICNEEEFQNCINKDQNRILYFDSNSFIGNETVLSWFNSLFPNKCIFEK